MIKIFGKATGLPLLLSVLSILVFLFQQLPEHQTTGTGQTERQNSVASAPSLPASSKASYRRLLEQSLFSLEQDPSESDFTIVALGTLQSADGVKALIKFSADKPAVLLAVGDDYQNWHMASLEPDHIILETANRQLRVNFTRPSDAKTTSEDEDLSEAEKTVREVEEIINGANFDS